MNLSFVSITSRAVHVCAERRQGPLFQPGDSVKAIVGRDIQVGHRRIAGEDIGDRPVEGVEYVDRADAEARGLSIFGWIAKLKGLAFPVSCNDLERA